MITQNLLSLLASFAIHFLRHILKMIFFLMAHIKRILSMLKSIFNRAIIQFLSISDLTFKPPTCRFYPTCSHYGIQSVKRFAGV